MIVEAQFKPDEYVWINGKLFIRVSRASKLIKEHKRNKGRWIIHEGQDEMYADMVCSSCKKRYQVAEIRVADIAKKFKFCPNCGNEMENGHDRRN